jgi:hypothetical protein
MSRVRLRPLGQALVWLLFAALVGGFTRWPAFSQIPEDHGALTLSLAHLTERIGPCVQRTPEELQELAPNMRVPEECPRERVPALIELTLDDRTLLARTVRPAGLFRGGRVYLIESWSLPAGDYRLRLRLRDSPRETGFDIEQRFELRLERGASAVLEIGDGEAQLINSANGGSPT